MLSIGPRTVMRYLHFATGRGIGEPDGPDDQPGTAVGLERVGKELDPAETPIPAFARTSSRVTLSRTSSRSNVTRVSSAYVDNVEKSQGIASDDGNSGDDGASTHYGTARYAETLSTTGDHRSTYTRDDFSMDGDGVSHRTADSKPHFSYGILGNHIGEACACWLARWGVDMLQHEEDAFAAATATQHRHSSSPLVASTSSPLPRSTRRTTAPTLSSLPSRFNAPNASPTLVNPPSIWAPEGLSTSWAVAVISSDSFYVTNELERYHFALRVYRFRKAVITTLAKEAAVGLYHHNMHRSLERERAAEKRDWDTLFQKGIYFSHLVSLFAFKYEVNRLRKTEYDTDIRRTSTDPQRRHRVPPNTGARALDPVRLPPGSPLFWGAPIPPPPGKHYVNLHLSHLPLCLSVSPFPVAHWP